MMEGFFIIGRACESESERLWGNTDLAINNS